MSLGLSHHDVFFRETCEFYRRRHRVLALLGTTDIGDVASPSEDGWFISDFYLFHYLLSPAFPWRKCAMLL